MQEDRINTSLYKKLLNQTIVIINVYQTNLKHSFSVASFLLLPDTRGYTVPEVDC